MSRLLAGATMPGVGRLGLLLGAGLHSIGDPGLRHPAPLILRRATSRPMLATRFYRSYVRHVPTVCVMVCDRTRHLLILVQWTTLTRFLYNAYQMLLVPTNVGSSTRSVMVTGFALANRTAPVRHTTIEDFSFQRPLNPLVSILVYWCRWWCRYCSALSGRKGRSDFSSPCSGRFRSPLCLEAGFSFAGATSPV